MTTDLRVLRPAEWDRWYEALTIAFGGVWESKEELSLWHTLTEFDRSMGIWDGDDCVGTAGAFSFRLSVPGGATVPAAGVTMVSVAATHRRRGLLTSMMRRQLDDVRAWGEPLAVLTVSEPTIYGRFGYGSATQQLSLTVDTSRVRLPAPTNTGTDGIRLRSAAMDDPRVVSVCEALFAAEVAVRPGMPARRPGWERLPLVNRKAKDGASALRCVLAERDGVPVGFTRFRVKPDWGPSGPNGIVQVQDLHAEDPAVSTALWRFLFDIDLTSTVSARNRPADDPLQYLVSDVRRCELRLRDSLWVRLVDVGAALEARTYRRPVDVVFEVADPFCPWNEGRWRLTGDALGASCKRTGDEADLELSAAELGAAYLGGVSLTALARAGRVRECRPGALAEASVAFGSDIAPWLPHGF